ncbi:MAG: SRPBCC domain-containing protein [Anaerolineaceae bacterium]|nr:SRPBCC domain-containing protein [Anaerolineaceae bacterium]
MATVDQIERNILLPASRERVWRAITNPVELCKWFASECEFRPEVGSPIRLVWQSGAVSLGVIEGIEPPSRFAFRWHAKPTPYTDPLTPANSTVVTFALKSVAGGTRLTVTETGFAALPDPARAHVLTENTSGWTAELEELTHYISTSETE